MAIATLATTRYVEVGTYIGQFFLPGAGALPNEARVVCLVGKGDRLIVIRNQQLLRSFVYREEVSFSNTAPFVATLVYPSDGNQSSPTRLFTSDGVEIPANKWIYVETEDGYNKIQIVDTAYDPTATYYLDYQSVSREVKDQIPDISIANLSATAQIREVLAAGTLQDQEEFREYRDYYLDFEVDPVSASEDNANVLASISSINSDAASGTGSLSVSSGANYSHAYNRLYRLEVIDTAGTGLAREATFEWTGTPVSFGNNALPATPLNPAASSPSFTIYASQANSLSQHLELGVVLDFSFGASNFAVGDVFYVQANGAGLIEVDPLLLNTNQFTQISSVEAQIDEESTGSLVDSSLPSDYTYTSHNLNFRAEVIAVSGVSPNRTATFVWSAYGTQLLTGSFQIAQASPSSLTQSLGATGLKISLSFGSDHFVVGDKFEWNVKAPRLFYKGKEPVRSITMTVGSAIVPSANRGLISGSFLSDTQEGKFGNWSADTSVNNGRFELNDGLQFYIRNAYLHSSVNASPGGSRSSSGDKHSTQCRCLSTMNFSLLTEEYQSFSNPSEIAMDITGAITGVAGAKYITLRHNPEEIIYLRQASDEEAVSYVHVEGSPFIRLTSSFSGDLECFFRWRGAEPNPGQAYFLSAKYLRPSSFYNKPILFLTGSDAEKFLAPSTIRNDLYIGSQIVFEQAVPGLFVIQVQDADQDGNYSRTDYKKAVQAFIQDRRATDLVVLNYFQALPDQLNVINRANDPFEQHESITYVGAPIDTPIGSELEPNSLVFLAKKPLAVFGNSPAHGTRVLVGHTRATRTIQLEDGSATEVTLDGSFVAAAVASLVSSFASPTETILQKTITSFNTIDAHTDQENLILGGAGIVFFRDEGSGIYRIREDVTVDNFAPDTKNLNHMTQKQFVTRDIRRTMNEAVISLVFPSAEAGISTIQSVLVSRLMSLETNGLIGRYQDAEGNVREIDPGTDAIVFRDPADPTLYHIAYNYFLATVAKRIFGLYTVNLPGGFPV